MAADYIPNNDAAFDTWFKFLNQYVAQKCGGSDPAWTHIPQAARTGMINSYSAWYTAYANTIGPHTPVETETKNNAKKASKQVIRPFVNQYLRFPPVADEDRTAMGIPNHDTIPTSITAPENQVEADVTFPGIHLVELRKIRPVSGTAPDTRSDYGIRIYYGFTEPASEKFPFRLNAAVKTGRVLPYSVFTRRKKEWFDFDGESGNTAYFCLRYENSKGEAGPFGPVLSAVIP